MANPEKRPGLLASVTSFEEAQLALDAGADIIDCKNPAAGALGALPVRTVRDIVKRMEGLAPVSATVGDVPLAPEAWQDAIEAMTAPGADILKIGISPPGDLQACLQAVRPLAELYPLVAVAFADQPLPGLSFVDLAKAVAEAGFLGVMLDTAGKTGQRLTTLLPTSELESFVHAAQQAELVCGLAGSLRLEDVHSLIPLRPDYLGFRSALCKDGNRTAPLDAEKVASIGRALRSGQ
jgi:uncharacterized protein (UPF0264 family)